MIILLEFLNCFFFIFLNLVHLNRINNKLNSFEIVLPEYQLNI